MTKMTVSNPNGGINVPYLNAYGNVSRALEGIKKASTPDRFTQDFLAAKLGLPGGSAKPVIPFLKRTGFLNSDGTPTELYKEFRNDKLQPAAAAQAVRIGYTALYEIHEYVHDLNDKDLKGVIVQATGLEANSPTVRAILGSFKALKSIASFDVEKLIDKDKESEDTEDELPPPAKKPDVRKEKNDIKLGYTINLNLPATSDIAVFNAIFKSLREHLLD